MFYLGHLIFLINKYNNRIKVWHFTRLDQRLGENDDFIAGLEMARWWAIEADIAFTPFTRHDIGLPEDAIRDVGNVYILERLHAGGINQIGIERDRTYIIELSLRHGCTVDF